MTEPELAYLMVGVADPAVSPRGREVPPAEAAARGKLFPYAPHSPEYVVDPAAIPFGTEVASCTMLELLQRSD